MPWPEVKGKPRSRNKDGTIRKKRSDAGKPRVQVEEEETECILECELCDRCEKVMGLPACNEDGSIYEWGCVGLITEPEEHDDIHDALNKIRICVETSDPEKLSSHEWTPWEAQMVALAMTCVVAKYLESGQPTHDQVEELLKNGYNDRLINRKTET